ncbi:MAG: winged helix-turn-helix domain-containing protein [Proteobacteria bacterium]|nr:winged helix-turn-helix domain-containing protein [Pseudomonadota bacterium]
MIYRFDDFELDAGGFELRRNGALCHVEPLVFDILLYLFRNPGQVIGRDEMIDAVWNGRIVSDATISSGIKSARKALGDSGGLQRYLQTVRGRGFRFTADVSQISGGDQETVEPSVPTARGPEPTGEVTGGEVTPGEDTGGSAKQAAPQLDGSKKPVIAVIPFDNLSAEADAFFADGLTEDIITNLARFRDLLVISRTSSFQFRGRDEALSEFCARLGAEFVVLGATRRAGGKVRITAQLVEAATGVHLWADSYDRQMEDIFAVQDEVTRTIAATLGVKVQDVALQRALRKGPAELDAYDCVLRARRYTSSLNAETHLEARELLERAIQLDPANADAYALLANVYLAEHRFDTNPQTDPIGRALKMAQTATALDGQNAYARCWLAIVHFFRGENDKFEAEAQRALDLNPNDPEILADIGHYLAFLGQFERGVSLSKQAQQLNPLHPGWYHFSFARYYYDRGEYGKVLTQMERAGMPDFYWAFLLIAAAQGQLGRPEAAGSLKKIYALKPAFSAAAEIKKWNAAPDDLEHLMEGLRKAGLKE